jgi:hypothetical protein
VTAPDGVELAEMVEGAEVLVLSVTILAGADITVGVRGGLVTGGGGGGLVTTGGGLTATGVGLSTTGVGLLTTTGVGLLTTGVGLLTTGVGLLTTSGVGLLTTTGVGLLTTLGVGLLTTLGVGLLTTLGVGLLTTTGVGTSGPKEKLKEIVKPGSLGVLTGEGGRAEPGGPAESKSSQPLINDYGKQKTVFSRW